MKCNGLGYGSAEMDHCGGDHAMNAARYSVVKVMEWSAVDLECDSGLNVACW